MALWARFIPRVQFPFATVLSLLAALDVSSVPLSATLILHMTVDEAQRAAPSDLSRFGGKAIAFVALEAVEIKHTASHRCRISSFEKGKSCGSLPDLRQHHRHRRRAPCMQ